MKKITRSQLVNKPIIKIGYCSATNLLKGLNRIGYMSGVYGWNCDVYDCDNAYILTGYRFYGISGKYADFEFLEFCENIAKNLNNISDNPIPLIADIRKKYIEMELAD